MRYSAYQNTSNAPQECWICLPIQEKGLLGIPVPHTWNHTKVPPGPNQTLTQGPVTTNVFLDARRSNVTCLESKKVSPKENPVRSLNPELCTSNLGVPNNRSVCTEPGLFLLCGWKAIGASLPVGLGDA
uniref:Uncharacterized protein n=1 Tax=Molossus molossus TaxID=27622 RepID=A0A7J8C8M0_MOLMO|nr:hypothetical protein HJG59_009885 [Molossus molossus]